MLKIKRYNNKGKKLSLYSPNCISFKVSVVK